jgi:branched-chain amino acid transport system substrate-binding protein
MGVDETVGSAQHPRPEVMERSRRDLLRAVAALTLGTGIPGRAARAEQPVRVGFSIAQTGPIAGGGQAALVALRMWADDVNARGGLLGRKVELVVYDDQGSASITPGIYAKLIDVDKVDLLIAPYGTVPTAPILPLAMQRRMVLMGNFSFQANARIRHDMWFNNAPWNDAASWSEGFFEIGRAQGARSIAFLAADNEFAQNLCRGARELAKQAGLKTVYDQSYPPSTVDFSPLVRGIRAARPEMVFVASYPADSTGIVRAVGEIGVGDTVKIFGGGMVGLQYTPIMASLGAALNGIVNYNTYVPGAKYEGIDDFFQRYSRRAAEAKVDPLGYYLTPFSYAIGQLLEQAVDGTRSLDHPRLAQYLRTNEMQTIVGPIHYRKDGEWANPRIVTTQFQGVRDKDIEQFKKPGVQVILHPDSQKNGTLRAPFEKARATG